MDKFVQSTLTYITRGGIKKNGNIPKSGNLVDQRSTLGPAGHGGAEILDFWGPPEALLLTKTLVSHYGLVASSNPNPFWASFGSSHP